MSPREKRLLIFFGIAGFFILNVVAFNLYSSSRDRIQTERKQAAQQLEIAEFARQNRDQILGDIEWLAEHEPEPTAYQDVQTSLQQLAESEATKVGLTVGKQRLLPQDVGTYFNSVKVQLPLSGNELALYQWIHRMNEPDQLRAVTHLQLSANREDDTKIDCIAEIEQWFVPLPPDSL